MKELKGIKLVGTSTEKQEQINNYIGELGGRKVRKHRNVFSGNLDLHFSAKRLGECYPSHYSSGEHWCEQPCFGHRKEEPKSSNVAFHEMNRIHAKAHGHYDSVSHYTLINCKVGCLYKAIVVCVREMRHSQEQYMTSHIAGRCPYCTYFVRY
jgi:hypothetical protein